MARDLNIDRTPGPNGEPWFMRADYDGSEPDWEAEGFVPVPPKVP